MTWKAAVIVVMLILAVVSLGIAVARVRDSEQPACNAPTEIMRFAWGADEPQTVIRCLDGTYRVVPSPH